MSAATGLLTFAVLVLAAAALNFSAAVMPYLEVLP
jgi:hypothetical protein